jgi:hypothetical protein
MAYVKIAYRKNANSLIYYVYAEKGPDDPSHGENCPNDEEGAKQMFQAVRDLHKANKGIQALHVIQSWSPQESKQLTPEKINEMGQALASRYFEGHQYLVVTHTHDEHHHNHIVVNPVHPETGKRITNKKKHLYQLRELSDGVCRENGLSVIQNPSKEQGTHLPDRVQRIERYNGNSYVQAMKDKALFARRYATSFDEYAGYLDALGVQLRIKDKTITYFYEDKLKGKRGDKLGREFTKDGLEPAFKENHTLFSSKPEVHALIRAELERGARERGHSIGDSGDVFLDGRHDQSGDSKDFKAYTESRRAYGDRCRPTPDKLSNCIVPIKAIREARKANLLEYCAKHRIELQKAEDGGTVLKGREHVQIDENGWVNKKNRTKGSAIEFAAIHGNLSYLQAISRVSGMPSLLELESNFGTQSRQFTSFHVPRRHEASYPEAIEQLGRFLSSFGSKSETADPLLRSGQAFVRKNGVIRLFPRHDIRNSLEFREDRQGSWQPMRRGQFTKPFFSHPGKGSQAVVFTDPREFMKKRGADLFSERSRNDGILVLMEPNAARVGDYLKENPHVKEIALVTQNRAKPNQAELDFFTNLRSQTKGTGVQVLFTEFDRALSRKGPELSL